MSAANVMCSLMLHCCTNTTSDAQLLVTRKIKNAQVPRVIGCASMVHQFGPTRLRYKAPPTRWEPKTHGGMQWEIVGGDAGSYGSCCYQSRTEEKVENFRSCQELRGVVGSCKRCLGTSGIVANCHRLRIKFCTNLCIRSCIRFSASVCASDCASDPVHQSAHQSAHQIAGLFGRAPGNRIEYSIVYYTIV